ncbi:flagellar filament capping protein FliD [Sedimenticola selenatireducens]|uniref:flagellar filament capping protein FliD n=1 Tax=Sedimenticola selenatireducens TaxID=191960 RepID=UPI00048B4DE9|nr:flagellar filament capping protein FliD [Sedimenticola selenatireducens]
MAISSPGLGSGLDVTGIVSQLMAVEQQPLTRLNQKEAQVQAQISAYGSLKGGLSSLQSAMTKLLDADTFQATKASSSDSGVLTVSSDTDAVTSSYNVTVNRLAQQHKLGSSEVASSTTFGGMAGDELTLTVGSDSFTLDLSTAMTLGEIQSAINVETNGTGVTAGLITGDSGNQTLVLTSGSTGYDNRVQLSFGGSLDANTFNFSMLNRDASNQLLAGENELDASLTVDGVSITRASNSVTDVIEGLTLNLQATGQSNISINQDSSVAKSAVSGFVNAYNELNDQLSTLQSSGASGSVLRNIENQLRGMLNTGLSGLGSYSYISQLGVTTNSDTGKLEFDSGNFVSALEDSPQSVTSFFSDEDGGFAARFDGLLEGFVKSGGTIDSIIDGSNSRIEGIERSRESLERRLEDIEARYLRQFGALDGLIANMTTTSEYLTSQLDILSNLASGNKK